VAVAATATAAIKKETEKEPGEKGKMKRKAP
jgi:hypothetical protein